MLLTMPFAYADGLEGYLPISMDHARFFNLSLQWGIRIVVASSQPDDALLAFVSDYPSKGGKWR